jgi:hypothetical protein
MTDSKILAITGQNGAGWVLPHNLEIEDGNYTAFATAPDTNTEYVTGWANPNQLPVGAVIEGIKVRLRKHNPDDLNVYDKEVLIFDASDWSIISEDKASPDRWPIGPFDTVYGDSVDMWSTSVDSYFINDGKFALGFKGKKVGGILWASIELDYCEITIYYTGGTIPSEESTYGPAIQVI